MTMRSSRFSVLATPAFLGLAFALVSSPAQAVTTVCTPEFLASVSSGDSISAVFTGPNPPCPASTVTASLNTGSPTWNAGQAFAFDIIDGPGTSDFIRTSITSVAIGADSSTTQLITLTFSQPANNPFLFFSFIDPSTSFTFSPPFVLSQANNASASGQTVTSTGSNAQADGFVVQLLGTYSMLDFTYNNSSAAFSSAGFTTGVLTFVPPVPGPLSLMGVAMGFGFSRKLRRRIRS